MVPTRPPAGLASRAQAARNRLLEYSSQPAPLLTDGRAGGGAPARPSLLQRLRVRRSDDDPLPQQLLRKYIAYARQYVHPVLSGKHSSCCGSASPTHGSTCTRCCQVGDMARCHSSRCASTSPTLGSTCTLCSRVGEAGHGWGKDGTGMRPWSCTAAGMEGWNGGKY